MTLIPAFALFGISGVDFSALARGSRLSLTGANGGALAGAFLYLLVWAIALLFVGARLALWQAVLVNERVGLRSVARSWRLTSGATWRLVGVILLFAIVLLVATGAAQSVVGIVFRLILGADIPTALFLGSLAGSAVSTMLAVVAVVFTTHFYLARIDTERAAEPL